MPSTIESLQKEIDILKRKGKEENAKAKIASQWVNADKRMPDEDTLRVLAWSNGEMQRCWHAQGKFYSFDGSWMYTEKERISDVSHWMQRDWLYTQEWPKYGPGIVNYLKYHWRRLTNGAQDMAYDLRPSGWGKKAQLKDKVVFFKDSTGRVTTGWPEYLPTPKGYQKIVCGTAMEAERYSSIQRYQDQIDHKRQQEERGSIEGQFADAIRSEMRTKMANARNNLNRDFMKRALERMDGKVDPTRFEKESYLHCEGYERGH